MRKTKKNPVGQNLDRFENRFTEALDMLHLHLRSTPPPLVLEVWEQKYRWGSENSRSDTFERVAKAIYQKDTEHMQEAFEAMDMGLWMPGGRVIAGAGTPKRVTLMNCYVNKRVEDSLDDIMQAVSIAALTQQQGGGIGTDFSTLRPEGAVLHRTGARASGPLPFMDMWHSMCSTIMSAGDRRGAMMGTLCDTHPDLPKFIVAKQAKDRLTNFNVSVLVSDAFVEAVRENEDWVLHFCVPPLVRDPLVQDWDFEDDDGIMQYAYAIWKARDLWELITRNTYEWSEPGIIFIDRVNNLNNLRYCEEIHCTNPCGEQPLPPNGTCNLGAINLSRFVVNPFREDAQVNWDLLSRVTKLGVRFLDNVIDVTNYPLLEQAGEEYSKRRIGLGVSGLADCFAQLRLRYGSAAAVAMTERIQQHICLAAYEASMNLAEERGPFPSFDAAGYLSPGTFASNQLSQEYQERIRKSGIRNGVLLTVAPTGTTSILYDNISSGIEPVFSHAQVRRVRQADGTWKEYTAESYVHQLFLVFNEYKQVELPNYMCTAEELTIEDHVVTQAAVQRWVDASVSKTINVSAITTYEEFEKVYSLAYSLGCKGCTTYRPSDVRGSILSRPSEKPQESPEVARKRPQTLYGRTVKIKWPSLKSAIYITINYDEDGRAHEVFLNSMDARYHDWWTALTRMITANFRRGGDSSFVARELKEVQSLNDTAYLDETFHPSLPAYIGHILEQNLFVSSSTVTPPNEQCPQCRQITLVHKEGCKTCSSCGYSNC